MTNYKILHDEDDLKRFIDFLPMDENNPYYYIMLKARKKHYNELPYQDIILERILCRKNNIINSIKRLEVALGLYNCTTKNNETFIVPNSALSIYMICNPIDTKSVINKIAKDSIDIAFGKNENTSLTKLYYSNIQDSPIKKKLMDIDFDTKTDILEFTQMVKNTLSEDSFKILKTTNGYHLIINLEIKQPNKKWYLELSKIDGFDKVADLTPIAGCIQGNSYIQLFN